MIEVSKRVSLIAPSMTLAISAKANELKAAGIKVINFGVGEPDFNTPEHICNAAKDALDKGYTKYVAAAGLPALKKAVVKKLKTDNNLDYDPSQIIISNGAKHSIFNAIFATINEGDEVLIPKPYWLTYPEVVKSCGGIPEYIYATARLQNNGGSGGGGNPSSNQNANFQQSLQPHGRSLYRKGNPRHCGSLRKT